MSIPLLPVAHSHQALEHQGSLFPLERSGRTEGKWVRLRQQGEGEGEATSRTAHTISLTLTTSTLNSSNRCPSKLLNLHSHLPFPPPPLHPPLSLPHTTHRHQAHPPPSLIAQSTRHLHSQRDYMSVTFLFVLENRTYVSCFM